MRTTLDLPIDLIQDAMLITKAKTKTQLITMALENIIKQERINKLIKYHGKVDLEIDLSALRKRWEEY